MNLILGSGAIRKVEKESGVKLVDLIQDYSFTNIHRLVKAGMGANTTDEQADIAIDTYLQEGEHELTDLFMEIMEALKKGGIFKKTLNLEEAKKQAEQQTQEQLEKLNQE